MGTYGDEYHGPAVLRPLSSVCGSIYSYGDSMNRIWMKLKYVKNGLKNLNTHEFSGIESKVKDFRRHLSNIQAQMRNVNHQTTLFEKEKVIKQHLEKWSLIEESIMKQKSRIQWLKLGDSNNGFFFVSMINRVAHNYIRSLVNEQGALVQAITEEILSYYKQLFGASTSHLPCVNVEVMRSRAVLNRQQLSLIKPVRRKEILDALKELMIKKHRE
ncbi:hypothetical protein H5410_035643 [Solanum commersonii]|uniref:Uncharacterized protein n=1 Tax=Solanum commersonii TaxID=4109 RepID=A0A9J5Y192_SOLCO|nr:hypothetical protein H5410_035643 [Solanum commersonii]